MNDNHNNELIERMELAAALPPEHPQRHAVTVEVANSDAETQAQWLSLIHNDEKFRLEMCKGQPPVSLTDSLTNIPSQSQVVGRIGRHWWTASLGLAAAVILALGISIALLSPARSFDRNTNHIALVAINQHMASPTMTVDTSDQKVLLQKLKGHLPYPIELPDLGPDFKLIGGATSTLDGKPVVYTRWIHQGQIYSLYQFCTSDFSLPEQFDRRVVCPFADKDPDDPCKVLVWTEQHCAYALVDEGKVVNPLLAVL